MENDSDDDLELVLLLALYRRRKRRRRGTRRNMWVRSIFTRRQQQGEYHNLLQEMRTADPQSHFRYTSVHTFSFALASLYPLQDTCHKQGKPRTASISFSSSIVHAIMALPRHVRSRAEMLYRDWSNATHSTQG